MVKVIISETCGLCYGSNRAITTTREVMKKEKNVILFKEILHNKNVIKELENAGARIKNNINELCSNDYVIIRAHGEPKSTYEFFDTVGIKYIDCTCPNVKAINMLVERKDKEGYKIIIIGKYGYLGKAMHPEVAGTSGWCSNPILIEEECEIASLDLSFDKYFLVVQTTFSRDKAEILIKQIKEKMVKAGKIFEYKNTICDAQKNINIATLKLANLVDKMIVIGGKDSSNTKELYNAVKKLKPSFHIENAGEVETLIKNGDVTSKDIIGLTAGASTMYEDIQLIKEILENRL